MGVTDLSHADLVYTERKNSVWYPEVVMICFNVCNLDSFRPRTALMLDVNFEAEWRNTAQLDGDNFVAS